MLGLGHVAVRIDVVIGTTNGSKSNVEFPNSVEIVVLSLFMCALDEGLFSVDHRRHLRFHSHHFGEEGKNHEFAGLSRWRQPWRLQWNGQQMENKKIKLINLCLPKLLSSKTKKLNYLDVYEQ